MHLSMNFHFNVFNLPSLRLLLLRLLLLWLFPIVISFLPMTSDMMFCFSLCGKVVLWSHQESRCGEEAAADWQPVWHVPHP